MSNTADVQPQPLEPRPWPEGMPPSAMLAADALREALVAVDRVHSQGQHTYVHGSPLHRRAETLLRALQGQPVFELTVTYRVCADNAEDARQMLHRMVRLGTDGLTERPGAPHRIGPVLRARQ